MLKSGLGVHGLGVIDHGGDALSLERGLKSIAPGFAFETESVLRPTGIEAMRNDSCFDTRNVLQEFGVAGGDLVNIG